MKLIPSFLIPLIFTFTSLEYANCQSTDQLDEIFGFKEFKLLSSIESYRDSYQIRRTKVDASGITTYVLNGDSYGLSIGSSQVEQVVFYTISDTIFQMKIWFDELTHSSLEAAFGKPTESEKTDWKQSEIHTSTDETHIWIGNKTLLTYKKYYSRTIDNSSLFGYRGKYLYTVELGLPNEEEVIASLMKPSRQNVLSDFSGESNSNARIEPCVFNTHIINVLNQNWYTGNGITLSQEDNGFGSTSFKLGVAKNKVRPILILELEYTNKMGGLDGYKDNKFYGNLDLVLENGNKVTCVNRNLRGRQDNNDGTNSLFSVYYLTQSEYSDLANYDIIAVLFKFGDSINGVENFVFDGISESFNCTIEGISDFID